MKPPFEISKNKIITYLLAFICVIIFIVALVSIPRVIRSENDQKASKKENNGIGCIDMGSPGITFYDSIPPPNYYKVLTSISEGIETLQSENEMLVRENSLLKKKVNYYFEYYRKNQPVGMEVAKDTVPLDSSWAHCDSIMFEN